MSEDNKYKAIIQMYSHGFEVTPKDPRVGLACVRLLNDWVVRTDKRVENAQGEMVTVSVPSQVYGIEFTTTKHYWFHKGQFSAFQTELKGVQLDHEDLKIEYIKTYTPDKVKLKLKPGRVLRDYQQNALEFAMAPVNEGDHFSKLIGMPTGTGKFQPNDTPVLTPIGWKNIGDIVIGDEVISVDGTTTKVIGVYPQGIHPVMKLTFADGRSTRAGYEHLWYVHNYDWRGSGWRVKNTLEVKHAIETKKGKVRVPLYNPKESEPKELPLHPYLLGALLGDGNLGYKNISFTKLDDHFEKVFTDLLPTGTRWTRTGKHWRFPRTKLGLENPDTTLNSKLLKLKLLGTVSNTKFIPDEYMNSSYSQRLDLIRGLLDTDGTSDKCGAFSFCSTSEVMAKQVVTLIRSIGGMAYLSSRYTNYTYKGEKLTGKKAWNISIRHKSPRDLFTLPRKRDRVDYINQYSEKLALTINKIEPDGHADCTCIEVDHPSHLYVCENYIVTHNTVTICGTFAENAERAVVCVLPRYYQKWQIDLQANLDISPKQIMPVEKTSQLKGLIHIAKEQGSKKLPPLIVLTMTTIRAFIDDYEADPVGCVQDYGCAPWELWKFIGAGVVGIDEAHEHLYSVFKIAMFLHGPRFIALSGTMRTEDDFQEKVQQTIFPRFKRYLEVKMEKYIDVEFIGYHFTRDLLWKIQYKAFGRPEYSHAVLEKSIIRYARLLNGYIEMVTQILDWDYLKRKQNGDKAIIYVATVDMADKFILALTTRYPDLKVNRYCAAQGDKYEDLLASDISVSTLQSSGTAVDIPGLICNVCTTMVNSSKANIQVLGRLRKLGDKKVTLYMPFCKDIPTHFKYTQFRYELFADITKSIKTFNYGKRLGE